MPARVSTDGPAVHLEGHDVVITNSTFPTSPIWDAMTTEYGDPYKPVLGIDSLRAAKAITDPADPVWTEVFELFGNSHDGLPEAELSPDPEMTMDESVMIIGEAIHEARRADEPNPEDHLAAPPLPQRTPGRVFTLAQIAEEMGVDLTVTETEETPDGDAETGEGPAGEGAGGAGPDDRADSPGDGTVDGDTASVPVTDGGGDHDIESTVATDAVGQRDGES